MKKKIIVPAIASILVLVVFSITSLSVLSAPQNAFAGSSVETTIIPYLDTNYKFKVVNFGDLAGFEQPTFDDSSFSTGDAGFGTVNAICSLTNSVNTKTVWPLNTDILLRKNFDLPAGSTNLRIFVAIDNDIQVFVNGVDVSGGLIIHEGCPTRDSFVFTAPDNILNEGENLLSVRAHDRGSVSYVDVRVVVDVGADVTPPVFDLPLPVDIEAFMPSFQTGGVIVNYDLPTAHDDIDPNPSVTCNPASGFFFPLGNTIVECTATDAAGNESTLMFNVRVEVNSPPIADAGPDQRVIVGDTVHLDGTGSSDPVGEPLTYKWKNESNCFADFSSFVDTSPTPTFIATEECFFVFSLIVSDAVQESDFDNVEIDVETPLHSLRTDVILLGANGDISIKNADKLLKWIDQAQKHTDKGQDKQFDKKLDNFIKRVEAFVAFGKLSDANGQKLIDAAKILQEEN